MEFCLGMINSIGMLAGNEYVVKFVLDKKK